MILKQIFYFVIFSKIISYWPGKNSKVQNSKKNIFFVEEGGVPTLTVSFFDRVMAPGLTIFKLLGMLTFHIGDALVQCFFVLDTQDFSQKKVP